MPDWQRRGVITDLVTEAERRFRDDGIDIVACLVMDDNEASKAGCLKLGYETGPITYFRKKLRSG